MGKPKIAIIDYDIGNVRSIINAFHDSELDISLTNDHNSILNSDGVILPGVGAFAHAMENLREYNLIDTIKEFATSNRPLLGICLGMQLLFSMSEEFGNTEGLDLINGKVISFSSNMKNLKLPNIGWNELYKPDAQEWKNTIMDGCSEGINTYFVHSYYCIPDDDKNILTLSEYHGIKYCSTVKKNNIYGCQYHPEKSSGVGLKMIENFANIVRSENI